MRYVVRSMWDSESFPKKTGEAPDLERLAQPIQILDEK
jgi:hypothetical protein